MNKLKNKAKFGIIGTLLIAIGVFNLLGVEEAMAGTLSHSEVMEYNMVTAGTSEVAFSFTTASAGATSVSLDFNGWTGSSAGSVNTTQTVSTTGCTSLTGATNVLPGSSLTAAGSGSTITVSNVTALAASTSYCAILSSTSAVTNPTASGVSDVIVTAGSDSSSNAIDIVSNDQYTVSATVAPTFTLSLSGNSDTFSGNLSSTALTTTSSITATVNTNAIDGWLLWAQDTNAGLRSASVAHTIPSVTAATNTIMNGATIGTEAYALGVSSVTSGNATSGYLDSSGISGGGLSSTSFNQIASNTTPSSNDSVVIKELADISATTPAASDYSDTITIVGAGSF